MRFVLSLCLLMTALPAIAEGDSTHYDREVDHVYATIDGAAFHMDVFAPNGKSADAVLRPNEKGKGLGIVDIVSGAWRSGRGKFRDHEQARLYDILTAHGYTVFGVRPGTGPDYDAVQMLDHIQHALRYIKTHAADWGVDPDRLGLTGASAGGHLAALATVNTTPETTVKAVALFFPPTDFLAWGDKPFEEVTETLGGLFFQGGVAGKPEAEIRARAERISPARQVKPGLPPIRVYHGDADPLVPLQQSEVFVTALKAAGNEAELVVKAGGGHPWLTIPFEIMDMADWFDVRLAEK